MARQPSIDSHATDIEYIKKDIAEIKDRLDKKYISHETFDLIVKQLLDLIAANRKTQEEADSRIIKTAMFFATPVYGAVILLVIKAFTQ